MVSLVATWPTPLCSAPRGMECTHVISAQLIPYTLTTASGDLLPGQQWRWQVGEIECEKLAGCRKHDLLSHTLYLPYTHTHTRLSPSLPSLTTAIVEAKYSSNVFTNEYQRSYKCNPTSTFKLTTVENNSFNKSDFVATIKLKLWQVQAFEFRGDKSEFGNRKWTHLHSPCSNSLPTFCTVFFPSFQLESVRSRRRATQ